jgi:peroxiredoxin Q/BCP
LQTQTQKHSSTFTSQVCRAELKVGDSIKDNPDYYRVLKRSDGGGIALSNFENKKPVVIFFYPKAATPGCTKQACKFRDEYGKFKDAGAEVFGISADTPDENAKFAKDQKLPFPLLSDQSDLLRKSFGIKADMFGMLKGRQTYVLDKKGKCVLSFNSQLDTDKHVSEALRVIASVT